VKRRLKRAVLGLFLLWLSSSMLLSVYYRVTFWDGAALVYAKAATALGIHIGHVERAKITVMDAAGRVVLPLGDPVKLTYAQLLLKFAGKDPVKLAIEDDRRGEAKSVEARPAYTDAFSYRHPIGTPCGTVRRRYWMQYSSGKIFSSVGGKNFFHDLFAQEEISFPVAQRVRQYNLALTLLPMYQEHKAFFYSQAKDKNDDRKVACDTLNRPKETDDITFNGTSYDVHMRMIDSPVDYAALRRRVVAELGLTEEEYAAEKEKYYAANEIYVSVEAGDLAALKAYKGDLKRRDVLGRSLLDIAGAFSDPEHPHHDVYIYLLREAGEPDNIFSVALKYGADYLRRYDIPFDAQELERRMAEYKKSVAE